MLAHSAPLLGLLLAGYTLPIPAAQPLQGHVVYFLVG
jgi:hypothetical protein